MTDLRDQLATRLCQATASSTRRGTSDHDKRQVWS